MYKIQYEIHFVEYEKVKNKLFICILNIYDIKFSFVYWLTHSSLLDRLQSNFVC